MKNNITQHWTFCCHAPPPPPPPNIALEREGKNESLKQGYSYLATQPSTNNPTGQALTLLHDIQRPNVNTGGWK